MVSVKMVEEGLVALEWFIPFKIGGPISFQHLM